MADDEDINESSHSLNWTPTLQPGTSWDTFFAQCDSNIPRRTESPVKVNNEFVTKMPYQKATCFGTSPLDNARYLRLIKCNQCDRIIKHVGYAHHIRRRHQYNQYEQNGSGSGDEAPDFLLSPPYTSETYRQTAQVSNSMSYVSEKRDGLLLVLKRTRVSVDDSNKETTPTPNEQPNISAIKEQSVCSQRSSKSQKSTATRLSISSPDTDCVALRTRKRQTDPVYFELPTQSRHSRNSLSIPKITVSRSPKNMSQSIGTNSELGSPGSSVIILDDDVMSKQDEESRQSVFDNETVEFSFVLPETHENNDELSTSLPPTTANSEAQSSRSSSIQSIHAPSKSPRLIQSSPEIIIDEPPTDHYEDIEEVMEYTPQSSIDYQNDNSLPSSSSPEMPQLERQDLYPPIEDSNTIEMAHQIYPTNNGIAFPPGTLVFTPAIAHHPVPPHAIFNGHAIHPTMHMINQIPSSSHQLNQTNQTNPQPLTGQPQIKFFYNPTTINNSEPMKKEFLLKQQRRQSVNTQVAPNLIRTQQLKRKHSAVVGSGTQLRIATSSPTLLQHQPTRLNQVQHSHPQTQSNHQPHQSQQRRRVFNGRSYVSTGIANAQQVIRPPPIILSKKPNMLLQSRSRSYAPVNSVNSMNGRQPTSSPSSVNSSSSASNGSSNYKFLYYNEQPRDHSLDDWKSPKGFQQLETRNQR